MEKTRVIVQIAGQTIPLTGLGDETYIRSIAEHVEKNVQAIEQKQPALSTTHCIVLAALNITEELFTLQRQYEDLDRRIDELRKLSQPKPPAAKRAAKTPVKNPFDKPVPVK